MVSDSFFVQGTRPGPFRSRAHGFGPMVSGPRPRTHGLQCVCSSFGMISQTNIQLFGSGIICQTHGLGLTVSDLWSLCDHSLLFLLTHFVKASDIRSRIHGRGLTISDTRSRTHGLGLMVSDSRSRTHVLRHTVAGLGTTDPQDQTTP